MAAVREVHAKERLAGFQEREERRRVRLCSRMRLYVGVLRTEQLLRAVDGDLLHLIDELATAIIPLAGQALRVLVRERRAHGLEHGRRYEVLAGNELEALELTLDFPIDEAGDLGVGTTKRRAGRTAIPFRPRAHSQVSSVRNIGGHALRGNGGHVRTRDPTAFRRRSAIRSAATYVGIPCSRANSNTPSIVS